MITGSDKIIEFQEMLLDRKGLKNLNYIKVDKEKYVHDCVNSLNYRGLEFDNNEILTLGCSQTWGYAMDHEFLWPTLIMNKFKKKCFKYCSSRRFTTIANYKSFCIFPRSRTP